MFTAKLMIFDQWNWHHELRFEPEKTHAKRLHTQDLDSNSQGTAVQFVLYTTP